MSDKVFFRVAVAWNLVAGLAASAQPALYYKLVYGYDGPIDGLWLQLHVGFWFLVALFGVGYALVAQDPIHNRGIVVLGVIGKLGFVLFWTAQILFWRATVVLLPGVLGDLAFVGLFIRWLRRK